MKSVRDGGLQTAMAALLFVLGQQIGLSIEVQAAVQMIGLWAAPYLYRGLRAMDNPMGKFLRDADPPAATPN